MNINTGKDKCQVCKKKAEKLVCVGAPGTRGIRIYMVCEGCAKLFRKEGKQDGQQKQGQA